MRERLIQLVAVLVAPLLTWLATNVLAVRLKLPGEGNKAAGAALASLVVFVITWLLQDLHKWWGWYRRRFDRRAAFEGWWLQVHEGADRVGVFSFLFSATPEAFRAEGNAFNSAGELLAEWSSTQVFFSDDASSVTYLWQGRSFEQGPAADRKGTTTMSLIRGRRRPTSGHGEVLHLNQARTLTFRLKRVQSEVLRNLLGREAVNLDDLGDFDVQKTIAIAFLQQQAIAKPSGASTPQPRSLARTSS